LLEVTIDLPWSAYLPRDYVAGQRLRIEAYRRLARIRQLPRLDDFRQEMRDRYGALPEPAEWLIRLAELRLLAGRWKVAGIRLEYPPENRIGPTDLVLRYLDPRRIQKLARQNHGRLRVVDEQSAYFRLQENEMEPEALYGVLKNLLGEKEAVPEEVSG